MSCDSRRMTVAEFISAVSQEAAKHPFVHEVVLLDHTDYAAKLHLIIRSDLFIQLYANVQSGPPAGTQWYTAVSVRMAAIVMPKGGIGTPPPTREATTCRRKADALWRSPNSFSRSPTSSKSTSCSRTGIAISDGIPS